MQPGGSASAQAEAFLRDHGIAYQRYNVAEDRDSWRRMVEDYLSPDTPTLVIDGEVFSGFDENREAIVQALGLQVSSEASA